MTTPLPTGTETRDRVLLRAANLFLPFYRRFPYAGQMSITSLDPRGVAMPEQRVFYTRIPKAANSTIMAALATNVQERAGGKRPKSSFPRPSRLSPGTVRALDTEWFKFTLVREPFSRALSAYLNKIEGRTGHSKLFYEWFRPDDGRAPTFLDFCRYLDAGGIWHDFHWAPQHAILHLPLARYDVVGRLERIGTDLPMILERIFGPGARLPGRRHGPPSTEASARLGDYMTPEAHAILTRLYAKDAETFGYAPPL